MTVVAWIFIEAISLTWKFAKLAFGAAVLLGLLRSLSVPEISVLASVIDWAHSVRPGFPGSGLVMWIAENWIPFTIASLYFASRIALRTIAQLETTSNYTKLFIATVGNYLEITTNTPDLQSLSSQGWWSAYKSGFWQRALQSFFRQDPYLQAWPERSGVRVSLRSDIQEVGGAR